MRNYSVFDILGPIMIGPSSSHTAGAARIGKIAKKIVDGKIISVEFILYESFAHTYKGHGTDKALLAGILGLEPDDERLPNSFEIAKSMGVDFSFIESDQEAPHPNTVRMIIKNDKGEINNIVGCSIGGGNVVLKEINGISVELTGEYETLITNHIDKPGIIASVTKVFANNQINIAYMRVYRHSKGDNAIMIIESDQSIPEQAKLEIQNIQGINKAIIINTI